MHGFHVFFGVCYLTVLVLQSAAGVYTDGKYFGITAGTLYWHFVDVIWVVLFSIFYLDLRTASPVNAQRDSRTVGSGDRRHRRRRRGFLRAL